MKELTHTDCGGELTVTGVYTCHHDKTVEFTCLKCKEIFSYEEFV